MSIIKIKTNDYQDPLRERLLFEVSLLKEDGIVIDIDEIEQGDELTFNCKCIAQREDCENLSSIFREYIANALSDVIINDIEKDFLDKLIKANYNHFSGEEKSKIVEMALDRLNFFVSKEDGEIISQIQRKNRILVEIVEYLGHEKEIMLEGFLRFRLKGYLSELKMAIDEAVNDFSMEMEYEEFVQLLKHFIDHQEPKNKTVNVVKAGKNKFKLLDDLGIIIDNMYLDEYLVNMLDHELDYEDLLISALITAAPKEIILHFKEPTSLIKLLKNIFEDKISICLGCEYCKRSNFNESE